MKQKLRSIANIRVSNMIWGFILIVLCNNFRGWILFMTFVETNSGNNHVNGFIRTHIIPIYEYVSFIWVSLMNRSNVSARSNISFRQVRLGRFLRVNSKSLVYLTKIVTSEWSIVLEPSIIMTISAQLVNVFAYAPCKLQYCTLCLHVTLW